jgi:hypothetical protein
MDGTRHQLLAGARLAVHQHRRHRARQLLHQRAHLPHGLGATGQAQQGGTAGGCGLRLRLEPHDGGSAPHRGGSARVASECTGHHGAELTQIDRLGQVVVGAGLEGLDGVLGRTEGGDDDGALATSLLLEPGQHIHARTVGQSHVGDDHLIALVAQQRQGLGNRLGAVQLIPLAQQRQLVQGAQVGFVVDDEQAFGGHVGAVGDRRRIRKLTQASPSSRSARYSMRAR